MSTFNHAEGWSVTGSAKAIARLEVIIKRYELLEFRFGQQLNDEILTALRIMAKVNRRILNELSSRS